MLHLTLIRHGNTFEEGAIALQIGKKTDLPLTSFGKKQIEELGEWISRRRRSWDCVFSGNLQRQKESAEILAQRLGVGIEIEEALNEVDYGVWEKLSSFEIQARWPKEFLAWTQEGMWPKGIFQESREEVERRIQRWIERLEILNKKEVLAVTSGGILRFFSKEKAKTGSMGEVKIEEGRRLIGSWNFSVPKSSIGISQ